MVILQTMKGAGGWLKFYQLESFFNFFFFLTGTSKQPGTDNCMPVSVSVCVCVCV